MSDKADEDIAIEEHAPECSFCDLVADAMFDAGLSEKQIAKLCAVPDDDVASAILRARQARLLSSDGAVQ